MGEMENLSVDLKGKVALVIAAGREPGRSLALAFAAAGASVAANDLTPMGLDETVERIGQMGAAAIGYVEDVSKGLPAGALVARALADFGRIDVLVNFAGARLQAALLNTDEWDWQRTLDFNLSGPFLMMKAAGEVMRAQGGGLVLNILQGRRGTVPEPGLAAYNASTSGLLALSQTAAVEFLAYNIRVHAICAGEGDPTSAKSISQLALFLCSPQAAGLTGQVFRLDAVQGDGKD